MSKNGKKEIEKPRQRASQAELDQRIRAVQEWILLGHAHTDIINSCMSTWQITDRQAKNYYRDAYKQIRETTKADLNDRIAFHIAARQMLFRGLKDKTSPTGARAAIEILKDIAAIEGLYVNRTDLTSGGHQIHSQEIITTLEI